jgi:hypothetical protein
MPSETTPFLHPSSPSLPIYKENVRLPHQVSKKPSSREDDLPAHQSFEEDISSDDWMSSDYNPSWSSEKEDPEEEDEDEDEDEDEEDDVDIDDDDDFDSDFDSPPSKQAR